MQIGQTEARVLGCLIEKELTTPDYYPLTLNALQTACNQSSNRDPVTNLDEAAVIAAIDALRDRKLVRWVKAARSRSAKYRHDVGEALDLPVPHRSLLAVLLLRGPQTVGELRTRTDRYHDFDSLAEVETTLHELRDREEPLTERLERQPGQKEARWQELLSDRARLAPDDVQTPQAPAPIEVPRVPTDLEALVESLVARVDRLERELGLGDA